GEDRFARRSVPHADIAARSLLATAAPGQAFALRVERDVLGCVGELPQRLFEGREGVHPPYLGAPNGDKEFAGSSAPHLHRRADICRRHRLAVWTEGNARNSPAHQLVALRVVIGEDFLPGCRLPGLLRMTTQG